MLPVWFSFASAVANAHFSAPRTCENWTSAESIRVGAWPHPLNPAANITQTICFLMERVPHDEDSLDTTFCRKVNAAGEGEYVVAQRTASVSPR